MKATDHRQATVLAWREKHFQQQVIDLARRLGWLAYHTWDSRKSEPGFPDLTLAHHQHGLIFAELKTEKGRLTHPQHQWIAALDRHTQVHIWRPRHWLDQTIHRTLNPSCSA